VLEYKAAAITTKRDSHLDTSTLDEAIRRIDKRR
jgi:hypothetical protein